MFQAVPPPIIRSSKCTYYCKSLLIILLQSNKYQKLYVQFELLTMGGGTA
jgi:hypothetical protein